MVTAKRTTALIRAFRSQSLFLFFVSFYIALSKNSIELYIIALLLIIIKVVLIPRFLADVSKWIRQDEAVGLIASPTISLLAAMFLTYLSYLFTKDVVNIDSAGQGAIIVALAVTLIGLFLMVFRTKALSQIIGLLAMENGLFLAAIAVSGGMPFFVEIAIFFDLFICVIVLGIMVFRINNLFTHIDVDKLKELKG